MRWKRWEMNGVIEGKQEKKEEQSGKEREGNISLLERWRKEEKQVDMLIDKQHIDRQMVNK